METSVSVGVLQSPCVDCLDFEVFTGRGEREWGGMPKHLRRIHGVLIRHARERQGVSVRELAAAIGVTYGTVWQWEDGRTSPSGAHRAALAHVLGCSERRIFITDADLDAIASADAC